MDELLQGKVTYQETPSDQFKENLVRLIEEKYTDEIKQIEAQKRKKLTKIWTGVILQLASAAVPFAGPMKLGAAVLPKLFKPAFSELSKKIVLKGAGQGLFSGLSSGGVHGLGRGLIEDEKLFQSVVKDALSFGVGGLGIGALGSKASLLLPKNADRVKELESVLQKRQDWGIAFRKASNKANEAVEKLIQMQKGFVPNALKKEGVGNIDFVWGKHDFLKNKGYGLSHIIARRNQQNINGLAFVRELPEVLKNGEVYTKTNHQQKKYIGDGINEVAIKTFYNKRPQNWVLSGYKLYDNIGTGIRTTAIDSAKASRMSPLLSSLPFIIPSFPLFYNPTNELEKLGEYYEDGSCFQNNGGTAIMTPRSESINKSEPLLETNLIKQDRKDFVNALFSKLSKEIMYIHNNRVFNQ